MTSLAMTMTVAMMTWCGISLWLASSFGRAAQPQKRPAGDEHALITLGAARPRDHGNRRDSDDSANDEVYDVSSIRHTRHEWSAI